MDYLRSTYTTFIWIHNGTTNSFEKIPISWIWAPPGATPIGIPHQYSSSIWTKPTRYPCQVGEVLDSQTYSKGAPVSGYNGVNHCGADNLWMGQLEKLTIPIVSNSDGSPACCGVSCPSCINGIAGASYTVVLSGGTGNLGALNGTYHLPLERQCYWHLSRVGLPWIDLVIELLPNFMACLVTNKSSPNQSDGASYRTATRDCIRVKDAFVFATSSGTGTAPQIQVTIP